MSLRLEMLQVARLAPKQLGEAGDRVVEFLKSQFNEDGGTRDRAGTSDLYYTVFGLESLIAFRQEPPAESVRPFLDSFGDGDGLDLVHLTCLARCWAALPKGTLDAARARRIADRIETHRAKDGGFAPAAGADTGTVYHGFLAMGALQDLGVELRDPESLARSIGALHMKDGAFANAAGIPASTTPTTAAAVTMLRQLGVPAPASAGEWLLKKARPEGGFAAVQEAPIPDLLSTATALHALAGMHVPIGALKEKSLDFIDTLWTGKAFCGNWADGVQDCEYTYYALLSLGHLSLA